MLGDMPSDVHQPTHLRLMRQVPLLARLNNADLNALAAAGQERTYAAGSVLFREGDPGDALHLVVHGRVRISMLSSDGGEVTVAFVEKGDCVGELALLDGGPRTATATATVSTRTFVVTRAEFVAWLSDRATAAAALLETLAGRLRRTDQALADLSFLDLEQRLAKALLSLSGGQRDAGVARALQVRTTQSELASMLSVSRESVNKQLNAFQREGWIALSRGSVTVRDPRALAALV